MKREPIVFIVGPARSGTSLLYRMLQQHPRFRPTRCAFGSDLTESKAFFDPEQLFVRQQQGTGALSYLLFKERYYSRFLTATRPLRSWREHRGCAARYRKVRGQPPAERLLVWNDCRTPALLQAFFYYAKKARGAQRLLEKTPEHLNQLPEMLSTFPSARCLCLMRHPLDVYSSYRRRLAAELDRRTKAEELGWLQKSVDAFCKLYAWQVRTALEHVEGDPARCLTVRYEDLTADPRQTIAEVLAFLGEHFDDACLPVDQRAQVSWKVDPHLFGPVCRNTKRWADYLSQEEARELEERLQPLLDVLGYDRYT